MKTSVQLLSVSMVLALVLASCGTSEHAGKDTAADPSSAAKHFTVDPTNSNVAWKGTVLGVKSHTGTLSFTQGSLSMDKGRLTGGSFIVDMKNYKMTDDGYAPDGSEKGTKAMLMGHLMSPDFFAADSFPTASLAITKVMENSAEVDLTVRGRTYREKVKDIVIQTNEDGSVTATGMLSFDRQKYGVAFDSGSKDHVLNDMIDLKVEVTGRSI